MVTRTHDIISRTNVGSAVNSTRKVQVLLLGSSLGREGTHTFPVHILYIFAGTGKDYC